MAKRVFVGLTITLCLLLLIGGAVLADKKPVSEMTIGCVINTLRHPYYVQIVEGYKQAAADLGVNIIIKDPDQDSTKQIDMIEELIYVHKVDALCVDPCVPGTLGAII
ncbi:hypothetical protein KAX17_07795, partial [Candidatus Bipolaricaulota bacterium]|nr:hypothetical protein [Candidatus Bipolaricaulota bacterium]